MTGLTSVTFRKETVERIVEIAAKAGLDGIEWGGDIHVPPGDAAAAARARQLTGAAGLQVLSYGSYYRLHDAGDPAGRFLPVLGSVAALGAPAVRIWAGGAGPSEADEETYRSAAAELGVICAMAAERGILVCLEYHRQTLTETCESALKLLNLAGCENLRTYWQPNPDISHAENCRELDCVLPWLYTMHVFQWSAGNVRHRLEEGRAEWSRYITMAKECSPNLVLEFVMDDSADALADDAAALRRFLCAIG